MKNKTLIGSMLANFHVQQLVGRGGMADVYHGIDVKLHRPVAIKVFDSKKRAQSSQANRFLQEARLMANWRHENIVQIYYAGDESGLYYYVMEFIEGYDLASIMSVYEEKGELMPIEDVLRIGDSVASALDYAHTKGVIHRDVKPANVMIANKDGRVVLGDFGLALDLNEKSQGEVFGSPHYIAPEQARRSSDAVPQSDLYALGAMLYEMIAGKTPFNDPNPASLALQHITDAPPSPRSINPSISVQVEEVLLKALEKTPGERYQSGKKLMSALRKAITAEPLKTQPDALSLPPIPVNAPTIRRSDISLNSFTHQRDVISALDKKITVAPPLDEEFMPAKQTGRRRFGWLALLVLLLLVFWGVSTLRPGLMQRLFTTQSKPIEFPTQTDIATTTSLPTQTVTVVTLTQIQTETAIPSVTSTTTSAITQTPLPSQTPTVAPPPISTVVTGTATPQQSGYLMTAYYNANSFYLYSQTGNGSRSVSGFIFERIDQNGVIQQRFEGWQWEKYFDVIQPNRCVSLKIYQSPDPYLEPAICNNRILSTLPIFMDSSEFFWQPNSSGNLFRVLWQKEEIARCEINAGSCDFYVP